MAIRLRKIGGHLIAICAARSVEKEGDVYLDDGAHYALMLKFSEDFGNTLSEEVSRLTEQEESNNPNREWWDSIYGTQEAA